MLVIGLPEDIEERLDSLARRTGRTKTYYAREAILRYLEDMEDICDAEQRLSELRAGQSHTIPLEEIQTRYGVED